MKNIQIIDGALNTTFSIFQASEEEFAAIFPDGRDIDTIEDVIERLGAEEVDRVIGPIWARPILKSEAMGIHGTLIYEGEERRRFLPATRREVDWDERYINEAQRQLFRKHRSR
jgi:hypothetical protein